MSCASPSALSLTVVVVTPSLTSALSVSSLLLEQTALVYLISVSKTILQGAEIAADFDFANDNFGSISAVHYLTQKHINGYPPIVSMMLKTHVPFDQGDYIVSFSGCKIFNSQQMCNMLFLTYFCVIDELCHENLPIDKSKYFPY